MSENAENFEDLFGDDDTPAVAPVTGGHEDGGAQGAADPEAGGAETEEGKGRDAADNADNGEGNGEGVADPDAGGVKVPLGALKAAREEKKGLAAQVEALTAQVAALTAPQAAPAPAPAPVPTLGQVVGQLDPLDPEFSVKLGQVMEAQAKQVETNTRLRLSREAAIREFGADEVNAAFEYFNQNPTQSHALMADASPFHAAVAAHRKQKALAEIGDDPAAYMDRMRQSILAELQATQGGQPPATQLVTTGGASLAGQPNLGTRNTPEWSGPETLDQILGN